MVDAIRGFRGDGIDTREFALEVGLRTCQIAGVTA